ncbi:hypothetical protein BH11BAC5_BH11BAC5_05450 [soil metagenome]
MNTDFEKRKEDFLNALNAKYPEREQKWWQFGYKVYTTTWQEAAISKLSDCNGETISIRVNLKKYLLLACLLALFIVLQLISKFKPSYFFWIVLLPYFIDLIEDIWNRDVRIVLSPDGIWLNKKNGLIPWNNIAASYIKKVGSDWTLRYLQLYFYDPVMDDFKKIQYPLRRLTIPTADLSFYIEWWKITTKARIINKSEQQY